MSFRTVVLFCEIHLKKVPGGSGFWYAAVPCYFCTLNLREIKKVRVFTESTYTRRAKFGEKANSGLLVQCGKKSISHVFFSWEKQRITSGNCHPCDTSAEAGNVTRAVNRIVT